VKQQQDRNVKIFVNL